MALIFESIQTDGIAQLSYLIGDDSEGVAAVFDPRADVDCYLQLAHEKQVSITHIFETHIHVDFVSGARELYARVESAKIYLSQEGGVRYGFDHEKIADEDNFILGSALIIARHTPGHTPEHLAYLLSEEDHPGIPWGVLTGDSLFVASAGRPDLLGKKWEKRLAEQLFHTLRDFYLKLDDGVIIYPAHGQGSPCGADIGGLPTLSIWAGWLLDPNRPILLVLESDDTLEAIVRYFVRTGYTKFAGHLVGGMKAWNNAGLPLESVGQMTVHEVKRSGKKLQILDVRAPAEWSGGHISNARNVFLGELREDLGKLDKGKPTAVYCDSGYRASIATSILQQQGFGSVCNIPGSWQAWKNAGFPVEKELKKKEKK
jgi:hydroxyacylglutathione hydrolase